MDPNQFADLVKLMIKQNETDITKIVHQEPYPSISPTRQELSQAGKTILVTGGGTTIGKSIAKTFTQAGATTIIITGRRQNVLEDAAGEIKAEAQKHGVEANVVPLVNDQRDKEAVKSLWANLQNKGFHVDVLVCNAGEFSGRKPLLEQGSDVTWNSYETNALGPLLMTEGLAKQPGGKPKVALNIATQALNNLYEQQLIITGQNPGYGISKNAGSLIMEMIAKDAKPEELQIVSFHPGAIHSEIFDEMGFTKDVIPFDSIELPGAFAVWAASKEARFLHGRYVWASWDVDELATGELRKRIDEEIDFLRFGVVGLHGARLAK